MTSSEIHYAALDAGIKAAWLLQNNDQDHAPEPYLVTNFLRVDGCSEFEWEVAPCWLNPASSDLSLRPREGFVEAWQWQSWDLGPEEFGIVMDGNTDTGDVRLHLDDESISFISQNTHDHRPDVPATMPRFLAWLDEQDTGLTFDE